jgi:preprotein translocase SecF subunit
MFTALFVTRQYFNIMVPSTLNKSEVNRSWLACGILAVIGGAIFAIGWLINSGAEKPWEGGLAAFGMFLLVLFAVGAVLLLSLWLFRIVYRSLGHQKANRLPMLRLLGVPKINWMGMYKTFWSISAVLIVAGYIFFEVEIQRPQDFFDIEFVGGTSVQVELEDEEELPADIQEAIATAPDRFLLNRVSTDDVDDPDTSVGWLHQAADRIEQANVADLDNQRYRVETDLTTAQTEALIMADDRIAELLTRGGVSDDPQGVVMQFSLDKAEAREITLDQARVREMLDDVAQRARIAADKLRGSRVQLVEETLPDGSVRTAFEIITTETSKQLVAQALIASMRDILQVTQPIEATLRDDPIRAPDGLFPIKTVDNTIADVTGGEIQDEIAEFKGGVLLVFDELQPPATVAEVEQRITEMRLQPDFADVSAQDFKVVGLTPDAEASEKGAPRFKSVAVALVDPNLTYVEGDENAAWRTDFAEKQKDLVQAALASSRSLQRVTQFAPQVASEATQKAVIAIILSLIAIAGYLWVRFGSIEFGLAGIIALFHDVSITLSAVMLCHFVHDTFIGKLLLLEDFKIDLAMIAAFLTIVGYSINDSIVIFDRIRENRGRLATVSATLINDSLNQTLSRTIITSATTFIAVFAMYIIGGSGIHGFAFALLVGVLSGTYSTIAIATPMLQHPRAMWVVTVAIISMMVIGIIISATSGIAGLMWGLIALVLAAAAYAIYRVMTSEATAARPTTA